jgi:hypothetical protein
MEDVHDVYILLDRIAGKFYFSPLILVIICLKIKYIGCNWSQLF